MSTVGLVVPVMKNFKGLAKLLESIDTPVSPIIINNWDENHGVSKAWNRGIQIAIDRGCEYAVVCNDDVVMTPGLIPKLTQHLDKNTVLVSPKNTTGVGHPRGLNFWCFAIEPAYFVERFGTFDENFSPAYFEDDDMAYRIQLRGGRILNTRYEAYHAVMGTQAMDAEPVVGRDVWDRNLLYYREKWGGDGGSERYRTPFNRFGITTKVW